MTRNGVNGGADKETSGATGASGASANGEGSTVLDPEKLGMEMAEQLFDLLDSWTTILEAMADQGVNPRPMLRALGRTLRKVADRFDPPAD